MGKSKDEDNNTTLILQAVAVLVGYLIKWWKGNTREESGKQE